MGNIAVIYAANLNTLARQSIFGGSSAFDRCMQWASDIPDFQGIVLLTDKSTEELFPGSTDIEHMLFTIQKDSWTEENLIQALTESAEKLKETMDTMFFVHGDCPLLDTKTTEILWQLHKKYRSEYTFADGYPLGLIPELLAARLPKKLLGQAVGREDITARNSLFEIIQQNINAYDVETHLSPRDMRMERVSITCDTRRNVQIAEALYNAGGTDADKLCRIIPDNRHLLRSLPAYFQIQVTNHCPQSCNYCPFPRFSGNPLEGNSYMDVDKFAELCQRIVEYAGDAVITPSLWGEPSSHPQIGEIIKVALASGTANNVLVLVETSGIGWNKQLFEKLAKKSNPGQLTWIISLDAADDQLYAKLRGQGKPEAEETARLLAEYFGKNCFVQAVRMHDNEENLENFYNKWKDIGGGPIIQKHNNFAGYLPNLQPAELSPLNRFPCWHLKRDFCILLDGTVPMCHCDIDGFLSFGNVFKDDLATIWMKGESLHRDHIRGQYSHPCAKCDEYYTFNY